MTRCPHLYAQHRPENVREKGSEAVRTNFAAHMYSYAFRQARPPSAHGRAGHADLRRARVHAPVQDQRQDGLRGRRLAVASGLWHLEERRPHARGARHERGDLPRRGQRVQRPADVHPGQPQARRARRRARRRAPPATRCGPSTTTPSASWSSAAVSWRPKARPGR